MTDIGKLFVIVGPSGAGKGTMLSQILADMPDIKYSISATTRMPRTGEIDGQHYFFRSRAEFEQMIEAGEFLEWAEFVGNYYGTPKHYINAQRQAGYHVILEIELLGAQQIKNNLPEAKFIFISPPNIKTLESRLRKRATDSEESIASRLLKAQEEMDFAKKTIGFFDEILINNEGEIEKSIEKLKEMLIKN